MSEQWYQWDDDDLILRLRVQPRASKDEFAGIHGERMKVRLTAPPVEGKANKHLCKFLAGIFGVAKSRVTVEKGDTGREKRVRIEAPRKLPEEIPPAG